MMDAKTQAVVDAIAKENAKLKREGGPAFPFAYGATNGADGLTKREYMATAILAGLCSMWPETCGELARRAVEQADALLLELAK